MVLATRAGYSQILCLYPSSQQLTPRLLHIFTWATILTYVLPKTPSLHLTFSSVWMIPLCSTDEKVIAGVLFRMDQTSLLFLWTLISCQMLARKGESGWKQREESESFPFYHNYAFPLRKAHCSRRIDYAAHDCSAQLTKPLHKLTTLFYYGLGNF